MLINIEPIVRCRGGHDHEVHAVGERSLARFVSSNPRRASKTDEFKRPIITSVGDGEQLVVGRFAA